MLAALASSDGKVVSQHFGHASSFLIVEVDENGWRFVERRSNKTPCLLGEHDESALNASIDLLSDCGAVFAAKIGPHVKSLLEEHGILPLERAGFADELLDKFSLFLQRTSKRSNVVKPEALKRRQVSNDHPCFSDGKSGRAGRLHLPVSAACNIQCRFCHRSCNADEDRPGTAQGILKIENVIQTINKALTLCPETTVVGIAGPGDALASPHALDAFREAHKAFPDLIKCLSTNGLGLPGKVQDLWDAGVRALTVTINAVDPVILDKIVSSIVFEGKLLKGPEACQILINRQLEGVKEAADAGMSVKINTVLIPGINEDHIEEVAKAAAERGAYRHNIIPLIPQHELAHIPAPDCLQIE
ncbi:MAG: radical SAM protein, partial [Clostridiales bacterium]|nr:radical SAM protein [Clostridiales bacterium]